MIMNFESQIVLLSTNQRLGISSWTNQKFSVCPKLNTVCNFHFWQYDFECVVGLKIRNSPPWTFVAMQSLQVKGKYRFLVMFEGYLWQILALLLGEQCPDWLLWWGGEFKLKLTHPTNWVKGGFAGLNLEKSHFYPCYSNLLRGLAMGHPKANDIQTQKEWLPCFCCSMCHPAWKPLLLISCCCCWACFAPLVFLDPFICLTLLLQS